MFESVKGTFAYTALSRRIAFDGVVVSDDLDMGAIAKLYSSGQAAIEALKAGVDILLICHNRENMSRIFNALVAGANSGDITMEKIDIAILRVLNLKEEFGLIDR